MTDERIIAIQKAWNSLGAGKFDALEDIYSADIRFEDPIATGRGIENLKRHFGRIFRNLSQSTYTYGGSTGSSGTIVMEWTLHAKVGSSGKAFELSGISWLQMNPGSGKIEKSREYFDLGKGVYEQIPILGFFIRKVKQRLRST